MTSSKVLIVAAATIMAGPALAAQTVDRQTVEAIRQMAIEAGQASSSTAQAKPTAPEAADAARKQIEQHKSVFFERVYAGKPVSETGAIAQESRSLSLSPAGMAPAFIDRESIGAIRQMAIQAGQVSSSLAKPQEKDPKETEAERKQIETHRASFFARAYGR